MQQDIIDSSMPRPSVLSTVTVAPEKSPNHDSIDAVGVCSEDVDIVISYGLPKYK